MALFYTDIESSGLNPQMDKILTIQYQKVDNYGRASNDLVILKEWESSEEDILKRFHNVLFSDKNNPFNFILLGQNTLFDLRFLLEKFKKYNLKVDDKDIDFLYRLPVIDLRSTFIIMNNLTFKNSGLTDLTKKKGKGDFIPNLYAEKRYDLIEEYIKQETKAFLDAFEILCRELPKLKSLLLNGK